MIRKSLSIGLFLKNRTAGRPVESKIEGKDLICAMEFSKKNIYSEEGILPLPKGQAVAKNLSGRLRSLGYLMEDPLRKPAETGRGKPQSARATEF